MYKLKDCEQPVSHDAPTVSVIVPCRNERDHIEDCIRSILNQEYPKGDIEFLVVDGMSEDGTRDILTRIMEEDSRLKVVDNPRRITPCARNIGIREARGQYVAILDAHTVYASSYIFTCVQLLEEHPEICDGNEDIVRREVYQVRKCIRIFRDGRPQGDPSDKFTDQCRRNGSLAPIHPIAEIRTILEVETL